ncbi:hypothetical protein ONZ45_g17635 [Pleurotus djamor]|nr:hypothetical protein ONZ45_g17635 [Pleurotus djamor]
MSTPSSGRIDSDLQLPPEILDLIITDYTNTLEDRRPLRHLLLVSRTFYTVHAPVLYESLYLTEFDQSPVQEHTPSTILTRCRLSDLQVTLSGNINLSELVHTFSIGDESPVELDEPNSMHVMAQPQASSQSPFKWPLPVSHNAANLPNPPPATPAPHILSSSPNAHGADLNHAPFHNPTPSQPPLGSPGWPLLPPSRGKDIIDCSVTPSASKLPTQPPSKAFAPSEPLFLGGDPGDADDEPYDGDDEKPALFSNPGLGPVDKRRTVSFDDAHESDDSDDLFPKCTRTCKCLRQHRRTCLYFDFNKPAVPKDYTPNHHSPGHKLLMSEVRKHCDVELLKIKAPKIAVSGARIIAVPELRMIAVPSQAMLDAFALNPQGNCKPSLDPFLLDLAGSGLSTPWNLQARDLFISDYLAKETRKCKDLNAIGHCFMTHLIRLRQLYIAQQQIPDEESQIRERDNRAMKSAERRRRSLRDRRAAICESLAVTDESLRKFVPVWKSMPWYAVSGDESDYANKPVRKFKITRLHWRSEEVTAWFRLFDHLHMSSRFTQDDRPSPGQYPRYRIPSNRLEQYNNDVPRGLPTNFYAAAFLASLTEIERAKLQEQPAIPLTVSNAIQYISKRFERVFTSKMKPLPPNDPSLQGFRPGVL